MKTNTGTKCSKPAGQYCRLHNPAPTSNNNAFTNAEDVFKKIEETRSTKIENNPVFQTSKKVRELPPDVPENLEEHVEVSRKNLTIYSEEQTAALRGYTGFAAGVCNNVLLGRKYEYYADAPLWKETDAACDFQNREDLVDYMETMDEILSVRSENRRIIYRGIPIYSSLHDEIAESIGKKLHVTDTDGLMEGLKEYYKPGKIFNNKTYLSTSSSAFIAADRTDNTIGTKQDYWNRAEVSGIMFELKTNAGVDVTGAAGRPYQREREVVLPRDTYFKVSNVILRPTDYKTKNGYDKKDKFEPTEKTFNNIAVIVQMVEVDKNGNEITSNTKHNPEPSIESYLPE